MTTFVCCVFFFFKVKLRHASPFELVALLLAALGSGCAALGCVESLLGGSLALAPLQPLSFQRNAGLLQ